MSAASSIARVSPVLADKYLFVEVETGDGRVGVGEAGAWAHIEATATALRKLGEYLVDKDAGCIERHWQVLRRTGSYTGSVAIGAVSAIDVADYRGRDGAPVEH